MTAFVTAVTADRSSSHESPQARATPRSGHADGQRALCGPFRLIPRCELEKRTRT